MQITNFKWDEHFEVMFDWLEARGSYLPTEAETPEAGFVVYDKGTPTAMAFLRRVEGGFGQLDGLVTNPTQPGEIRGQAIDLVVEHILNLAQTLNIKSILSFSVDKNTLLRSVKHGFVPMPHILIAVDPGATAQLRLKETE